MAFETIFDETPMQPGAPEAVEASVARSGGVSVMAYDQRFANSVVKMNVSFGAAGVTLVSNNGEQDHTSDVDLPEEAWLGRMRARLEFARRCRAGESSITVQTMRPELGPRVVNLSSTLVGVQPVWDGTAMVDATIWSVQISGVPVNMSEAYPVRGPLRCYRMLHMALDMPFGYLLATIDTEANAIAASQDDPDRKLPELVSTMFVSLSAPIVSVYEARMVRLRVRAKGDRAPAELELPSGGFQVVKKIEGSDSKHVDVTIDLQAPQMATDAEKADKDYLLPSAMVDSTDEVIIELSHKMDAALMAEGHKVSPPKGKKLTPRAQLALAYALRDLVHEHISSKHLSTAYASASETARTGSGDCTEHAVLLAAVLKARSIPARVCHGLVYVELGGNAISGESEETQAAAVGADGAVDPAVDGGASATAGGGGGGKGQFGWHMWTQGMVNGRWLDFDATLHVPFSVGHVLVGTSSMSDKEAHNNHMQMAALIGNLEIDLLETSHEWKEPSS
jgi:transglutaminase-like putative cysteine protease